MLDLRDQILVSWHFVILKRWYNVLRQASPKDIEDLVATGQDSETCPYFGSRRAIRQAQVSDDPKLFGYDSG